MKRSTKRYTIEFKVPYQPFWDEAKLKWPTIANTEPTDADLAGLAYKMIVKAIDKPFDSIKEHLRVFQDSDIQVDFDRFIFDIPNPNKINQVIYKLKLFLAADHYEAKPDEDLFVAQQNQHKLNSEFERLLVDLEEMFNSANITII